MIGNATISGNYICMAENEVGKSTIMKPFYIDGKWVTRIHLKYQHLNANRLSACTNALLSVLAIIQSTLYHALDSFK